MTIRGTIKLPRCWKRLIGVNFCYADDNLAAYAIEGFPHMLVKGAESRSGTDDPDAYYDDCREAVGKFEDGAVAAINLNSGQGNYYASSYVTKDGEVLVDDEGDPLEYLDDEIEFETNGGASYVLKVEWEGEDPYEEGYPAEPDNEEE
jgi:predicted dehydrogenase